jgi:hypothetical protein
MGFHGITSSTEILKTWELTTYSDFTMDGAWTSNSWDQTMKHVDFNNHGETTNKIVGNMGIWSKHQSRDLCLLSYGDWDLTLKTWIEETTNILIYPLVNQHKPWKHPILGGKLVFQPLFARVYVNLLEGNSTWKLNMGLTLTKWD